MKGSSALTDSLVARVTQVTFLLDMEVVFVRLQLEQELLPIEKIWRLISNLSAVLWRPCQAPRLLR